VSGAVPRSVPRSPPCDVIIISLVLVMCCVARGLLGRRERLILALVLGTGVFAAGQFSTWIATAVAFALLAWRFPDLRRQARRFAPLALVALGHRGSGVHHQAQWHR